MNSANRITQSLQAIPMTICNPYEAAARGYVDAVIEPHQTRGRLIAALRLLSSKRERNPPRKHGNVPL